MKNLFFSRHRLNSFDNIADWYFHNKAVTLNISIMHTEQLIIKYWVIFTSQGVERQMCLSCVELTKG